ncbi:LysM peptidoglycan-binding domain-containing protein [Paenibacillus sp. GCM10027627]|uniref:LysM peptidoglycan-binding domain-containing protein n=1 Tax=unclassified Paenibacillus TaxID=185978 RepID=UPI0036370B44
MMMINESSYRSIHNNNSREHRPNIAMHFIRHLKRNGAKVIASLLLAALLFSSFLLIGINASGSNVLHENESIVTVKSGDTLWGIANQLASKGNDTGYLVFMIKNRNNLEDATIKPGQKLIIPDF